MKTHIILTLALMCMAVTSCETELDINADISRQLCVFALATPGQELEVYVSSTQCIEDAKYISQKFSLDTYKKGSALKYYKQEYLVDNAQVILTVNNTTTIVLPYDSVTLSYHCGYTPTINDHLDLSVTAEDFEKATASTYIPTPQGISDIEFTTSYSLAVEASIRDYYDRTEPFNDYFGSDSIAIVKFGFHDPGRETNYYLLRPRSIAEIYNKTIPNRPVTVYSVSDVFFSEDPVFFDKQLKKGYGSWEPYVSNIFTDELLNGKQNYISFESRIRRGSVPRIILELQSISKDLYLYLKSMQIYERRTDDVFASPVSIYTNVRNGWGVFGSMSSYPQTIYLHR